MLKKDYGEKHDDECYGESWGLGQTAKVASQK